MYITAITVYRVEKKKFKMGKVMKNTINDLEYYANLPYNIILEQWDDGQGPYWVARVAELPHCLIHGDTPEEAVKEIDEVKRDWIKSNLERGLEIPEPVPLRFSGQITLRMPPSLHRHIANRARVEQVSINQYMVAALAQSVGATVGTTGKKAKRKKSLTRA